MFIRLATGLDRGHHSAACLTVNHSKTKPGVEEKKLLLLGLARLSGRCIAIFGAKYSASVFCFKMLDRREKCGKTQA